MAAAVSAKQQDTQAHPSHLQPNANTNHQHISLLPHSFALTAQCASCSKTSPSFHSCFHQPRLFSRTAPTSPPHQALQALLISMHLPTQTSMHSPLPPSTTRWTPLGVEMTPLVFQRLPRGLYGTQMHWTTTPATPLLRPARVPMSVLQPWVSRQGGRQHFESKESCLPFDSVRVRSSTSLTMVFNLATCW